MFDLPRVSLFLATFSTALMAGLFFSWACSVTVGLAPLPDVYYLAAMQSMNRAIQNPFFFSVFFGAPIFLCLSCYLNYHQPVTTKIHLIVAATVIYLVGALGVTMFGNIPLNNSLNAFSLTASSPEQMAVQRMRFELPWNRLHLIRTMASIISLVLIIVACITNKKPH